MSSAVAWCPRHDWRTHATTMRSASCSTLAPKNVLAPDESRFVPLRAAPQRDRRISERFIVEAASGPRHSGPRNVLHETANHDT